jgi:predicted esterase
MGRRTIASGRSPLIAAAAVLAAAVPGVAAGSTPNSGHHRHGHPRRPDLTIARGSLASAKGSITGSFVVKNAGGRTATKSQAVVLVAAGATRRVVQVYAVRALKPGGTEEEAVSEPVPDGLPVGTFPIRACADYKHTVKESRTGNDCMKVGSVTVASGQPGGNPGPGGNPNPGPVSTVPTAPANLPPDTPTFFADGRGQYGGQANTPDHTFTSGYYAVVPTSYDPSNQTPTTLLVWLHGCGGEARYDISDVSTGVSASRHYVAIAPSGPEGVDSAPNCWDPNADVPKVLADIAQAETQFNIERRRVIIAGYSSGGDLGYRTIFENAKTFAGILAMNTSPYRDTGKSLDELVAGAAWKFNIVQIAHDMDDTYPPGPSGADPGVTATINQLKADGFPVDYLIRPGHHYDADTCPPGGLPNPACIGTTYDLQHYLLPHVDADGWLAPVP